MENTEYSVYCLIRKNPSTEAANKLLKRLNYYFGDKYNDYINKRIFVIESDVTQDNLGISNKTEKLLDENISSVINSAANAKHYGYYSDFEKINVIGVKNLVEFSKKYNKKFVQISTISVSGNTLFNLKDNKNDFKTEVQMENSNLIIKKMHLLIE